MRCDGMASPFFPPSFLLQMQTPHEEEEERHLPSFLSPLLPNTTPCANVQDFHGLAALLGKRNGSLSACEEVNGEEDLSDDCSAAAGEKKRRLNLEQVRTLERSFEMGNKLEPERKIQLARALGLQPRQVAIWFQNRRARWKTKQLEKDYGELKRQMEAIKEENDALQAQNKKLEAEIVALRGREASEPINLNKDQTEGSCSNRSDNSCDINLDISRTPATESPVDAYHVRPFFQPVRPAASVAQLLQYPSSRPEEPHCPKVEHGVAGQDESFCNMFSGLDDQPGFCWAWSEQHSFH